MSSSAEKFGNALARAVKGAASKFNETEKPQTIAYYIGEHEIHDEAAFADYLKQVDPDRSNVSAAAISPSRARTKCSKAIGGPIAS